GVASLSPGCRTPATLGDESGRRLSTSKRSRLTQRPTSRSPGSELRNPFGVEMKREVLADTLVSMIAAIQRDHPLRVGIDGVDGVGKTTLADELVGPLRNLNRRVIRASVDGFHNPASIRYRQGPLSPRGYFLDSFNYEAL